MRYLCPLLLVATFTATASWARKTCDLRADGATGDGKSNDTHSIRAAIDDCAATKRGGCTSLSVYPATGKCLASSSIQRSLPLASPNHAPSANASRQRRTQRTSNIFSSGESSGNFSFLAEGRRTIPSRSSRLPAVVRRKACHNGRLERVRYRIRLTSSAQLPNDSGHCADSGDQK